MKKIFKRWLLPAFTLLLIITGAVMPFTLSALQDRQLAQATESRQFSPVNLTLQQSAAIDDVLQLMTSNYDWFSYAGPTQLSADEAISAAKNCLQVLSDEVMPMPVNTNSEAEVNTRLAFGNDGSDISAILWICTFQNEPLNQYVVIIDDASGKMVELVIDGIYNPIGKNYEYIESNNSEIQIAVSPEYDIEKWLNFCRKYYDIEIVDCDEVYSSNSDIWCIFLYQRNNLETTYNLILHLYYTENTIWFN